MILKLMYYINNVLYFSQKKENKGKTKKKPKK